MSRQAIYDQRGKLIGYKADEGNGNYTYYDEKGHVTSRVRGGTTMDEQGHVKGKGDQGMRGFSGW